MNAALKFIRWLGVPTGLLLIGLGLRAKNPMVRIPVMLLGSVSGLLGGLVDYWSFRPNRAWLNPSIPQESWIVVDDGQHNSNTDMIYWKGAFYLVHAASPYHLASASCHLVVLRSPDGRQWEQIARLDTAPVDIRDPKLAVIGEQLFLYALKNIAAQPRALHDGLYQQPGWRDMGGMAGDRAAGLAVLAPEEPGRQNLVRAGLLVGARALGLVRIDGWGPLAFRLANLPGWKE